MFFLYTPIVNCNFVESDIHQPCRTTADAIQSATDVKKWLAHGHRGAYDNQSRKRHATEESRYSHLNKIFE